MIEQPRNLRTQKLAGERFPVHRAFDFAVHGASTVDGAMAGEDITSTALTNGYEEAAALTVTWSSLNPNVIGGHAGQGPAARMGHTITPVGSRHKMFLFGGNGQLHEPKIGDENGGSSIGHGRIAQPKKKAGALGDLWTLTTAGKDSDGKGKFQV
jgi:hypothetical protein